MSIFSEKKSFFWSARSVLEIISIESYSKLHLMQKMLFLRKSYMLLWTFFFECLEQTPNGG
ncbi:hypothetical protein AO073_24955 [Pseudomonas syringae ICMP 11293]|nr:hypothetical protein AO073_24955 [Pseudomonas syringae ICMP 11293]